MSSLRYFADSSLSPVVAHLWSSTLFLLLILTLVVALRGRLTAGGRFALALIGILKFAIPAGAVMRPLRDLFRNASPEAVRIPLAFLAGALPQPTHVTPPLWPAVAGGVWLAIAIAMMLGVALMHHRLVALSMRTALPPRPREVEALTRARRRVGVRRSIDIARSALPEAPAVLRVLRPLIVLPAAGCDDLTDEELESLLCHECAHVARHDNLIARIESLICALFWFHPLLWIAQRITVIERERACDEVVAGSADERETYLAALTKFCHAAIAPRLPGVSCMATAKLTERMDHVMKYETLKAHAASPRRVAILGTTALMLFTLAAGIVGTRSALAGGTGRTTGEYAIKIEATRTDNLVTVDVIVTENSTQKVIAVPKLTFARGTPAETRSGNSDAEVVVQARPDTGDWIAVDVRIERDGRTVQEMSARVVPTMKIATAAPQFTGELMSMQLKDADLRDVIKTFGQLTGLEMRVDDGIEGTVSVHWINVPWDQAFDTLLSERGLTYKIENKVVYISKK